ncbi:TerB family tellurite resistance protein [Romeria aff. gracilis LEGE 07310]|uniref:TerB family tellurite resistance protein n=1 Tax=Vasconcelosia minhoensis LEGE 07310 TaxID=915328 RepID=A0A8J7DAU5_9CYAN|nr:TerB family tellurite resistance protein [Romeria gracilis]MBE9076837.1 TerB family tellurite resistance protein [Romeria aff. gracilis LEGE 07310]
MNSQPSPPAISPRQMNLLRVVLSMAWSDGNLEQAEVDVMLDRFSRLFAKTPERQTFLREELQSYLIQNVPLEESVPHLTAPAEKELVLRLGYEVISASARTPDEAKINQDESQAYQKLLDLLDLPEDVVQRVEQEAEVSLSQGNKNVVDLLIYQLRDFWSS